MRSVCVSCGNSEKGEMRDCPKCGSLMLDGPLPAEGSIKVPPRVRSVQQMVAIFGGGIVLFVGGVVMAIGSATAGDPTAGHAAPAAVGQHAVVAEALPVATPAPVVAAAPAPVPVVAKAAVAKVAAPAKKAVAKKAPAKKTVAKKSPAKSKKVAQR